MTSEDKIKVMLTDGTEINIQAAWWNPDIKDYNDEHREFIQIGNNIIRKSSILRIEKTEE